MRQVALRAPALRVPHQAVALGTAVACMTAAAGQLCCGLGGSAAASRRQQLAQQVHALRVEQQADIGSVPEPAQLDCSLQKRLAPLLTDGLHPKVGAWPRLCP
jgi:hypothetical protein